MQLGEIPKTLTWSIQWLRTDLLEGEVVAAYDAKVVVAALGARCPGTRWLGTVH